MAENTRIEWCDHTVSFWWGCEKVSAACANCYADSLSNRFGPKIWGANSPRKKIKGAIGTLKTLNRKARERDRIDTVFINSMSDFFEADTGQSIIDHNGDPLDTSLTDMRKEAFRYMGECRNLKFLMLTKRPENIRPMWPVISSGELWKTNRFWLGTTVENQPQAEIRIPKLLRCRDLSPCLFLSCEPLLSELNLQEFYNEKTIRDRRKDDPSLGVNGISIRQGRKSLAAPKDQKPLKRDMAGGGDRHAETLRHGGKQRLPDNPSESSGHSLHCESAQGDLDAVSAGADSSRLGDKPQGRGEEQQPTRKSGVSNKVAKRDPFVTRVRPCERKEAKGGTIDGRTSSGDSINGRDHAPFADSRVVQNDDSDCSTYNQPKNMGLGGIDWVIVGGESGPNARPSHPDWYRSLLTQCRNAGVPFFFKQWGEYRPADQGDPVSLSAPMMAMHPSGKVYEDDELLPKGEGVVFVHRVGKKKAGRLLDGVEHNGFPEIKQVVHQ